MPRDLIEKYSEIREKLIENKHEETLINVSLFDLGIIITGLKMSKAYDDVIDEELEIKYSRKKQGLEDVV